MRSRDSMPRVRMDPGTRWGAHRDGPETRRRMVMKQVSIGTRVGGASLGAILLGLTACGDNHTPAFAGAFRIANGISDSNGVSASATSGFPSTAAAAFDTGGSI